MNRTISRLLAGIGFLSVPTIGYGQKTPESKSAPARQTIERRAPIAPDASIRIAGAISSLKIIGWDRDSLAITGTAPVGARFDGGIASAPAGLSRGAKFYLETPNERFEGATLELRVPHGARVWAKSGSASVEVNGVTGGLDLNVVGGKVVVSSRPRELNIESMDGDVYVMAGAEWLRVKTATGGIEVRGGSEDAGLSTVSGAIRVADGRYERGKFETVTGDITYRGDFGFRGSMDLTTHSGRIELQSPPRPDLELDAATVTGAIENAVTSSRPVTGREGRGMELGFSSGNGATRVVVRSFKGNIALKPR
jgi:hypothetical protein